jgi:hypothetical protein
LKEKASRICKRTNTLEVDMASLKIEASPLLWQSNRFAQRVRWLSLSLFIPVENTINMHEAQKQKRANG